MEASQATKQGLPADEVNIERAGKNYSWPIVTYGEEYDGGPIGEGITHKKGMEQPLYYWLPSIAPSGMLFYTGEAFPRRHALRHARMTR